MGKIILALLLVLALFMAMPRSFAEALDLTGTYLVYSDSGDRFLGSFYESERSLEQAKQAEGTLYGTTYKGDISQLGYLRSRLMLTEIWQEVFDGVTVIYAYSPLIKSGIRLNGRLVNIQIAIRQDALFVGSPILLGSY